jgi:alpha-tubulin suppressor-like RCC1 family protein
MSHFRDRCALGIATVALVACRDPSPSPTLGASLVLLAPVGASAAVDSYRVVLKSASGAEIRSGKSGETIHFSGLKEGSYTLAALGLIGGQVEYFFADTVDIGRLADTSVTLALSSFQPTLTALPALSIQTRTTVHWTTVIGAERYILERASDNLFSSVETTSLTTNQADLTLAPGQYFFRVRAVNEFVPPGEGVPSGMSSVEIAVPSLAFTTPPSLTALGQTIASVRVTILAGQRTVTSADDPVTVALVANQSNGVLSGSMTANAINGVATFNNLSLDKWGAGYTLRATLGVAASVVSAPFDVRRAFLDVSGGDLFTCSLLTTGAAYCWGSNDAGQLGDNSGIDQSNPAEVRSTLQFSRISSGARHACALTTSQRPVCWGSNDSGQVGDGSIVNRPVPVLVGGSLVADVISAGGEHSCAVRASAPRRIFCWGANNFGQLGTGSFTNSPLPGPVSSTLDWQDVSAGLDYTCAIRVGGGAFCWGRNDFGQLGDSTLILKTTPTAVLGGGAFTRLTTGDAHSCAIVGANVFCWGSNASGQLGIRSLTPSTVPVQVLNMPAVSLVAAGGQHTCALATTGEAWCWGSNSQGQLGDGTTQDRLVPTRVVGGLRFVDLSAGRQHTCGLTASAGLYCWGYDKVGQLGNGTFDVVSSPRVVTGSMP